MKKLLLITFALPAVVAAWAQGPAPGGADKARPMAGVALCSSCGTVQEVKAEQRKGKGGAAGIVGGAVVGGLLGHQVGGGTGKTLATVAGAAAGGYAGNEVQKHVTSKQVWVTRVRMKDGTIHTFEQEARPAWSAGQVVKVQGRTLSRI